MWQVSIHKLVMEEDFQKINKHDQFIILKTINKKLSVDPEGYGEGLKHGLKARYLITGLSIGLTREQCRFLS